jgi:hypothetical protein
MDANNEVSVEQLEIASGLKELLQNSGYYTVKSITKPSEQEFADSLGIDLHIAKIIVDAAKGLGPPSNVK